jgi:hypothetical protein
VHTYYFYIESDSQPELAQRASRIEMLAETFGLLCHKEQYANAITLHVETDDQVAAFKFRVCVEVPLHESRGA